MSQHNLAAGLSTLHNVCSASGGSTALVESTLRSIVQEGGVVISSGELARLSRITVESWRSCGGSRTDFAARIKERLGDLAGGRRFLAALTLAATLQGLAIPWAAMAEAGNSDRDETYVVESVDSGEAGYVGPYWSGSAIFGETAGVYSGGSTSDITLSAQATMWIYDGGVASDTKVNFGTLHVYSNGSALSTIVSAYHDEYTAEICELYVHSGGSALGIFVAGVFDSVDDWSDRGFAYIESGGFASGTTLATAGTMVVSSGGSAFDINIKGDSWYLGRGELTVMSGGVVSGVTFEGEMAYLTVSGGGSALGVDQRPYGGIYTLYETYYRDPSQDDIDATLYITKDNTLISGTNALGSQFIVSNGYASGIVEYGQGIEDHFFLYPTVHVASDGFASATKLLNLEGGNDVSARIDSGGSMYDTYMDGGCMTISSGGLAVSTEISGGRQDVYGSALSTYMHGAMNDILAGQHIYSGGVAISNTITTARADIERGGGDRGQTVYSGGSALYNTIFGDTMQVIDGGVAISNFISSGASQYIRNNGSAIDTVVTYSGSQIISSGLALRNTISSGGSQMLSGGVAMSTTVSSGGVQDIFGGIASNNFISDGGSQTLYGGLAIFTEISAGGGQFVSAGGLASSTSIKADGSQTIFDHGIARDTVISGDGHQLVSSGGSATSTHIEEGGSQTIFSSGIASDTVVSSKGLQDVSSGGLAISTTVSSGGVQELHAGSASAADIKYGGSQVLYASASDFGAHLSGDQLISQGGVATSTHVEDGGSQTIFSGGSAIATEVSSGGMQIVSSAGTALSTRISSGGSQVVEASGVASNATIFAYGTQIISSAGSAVSTTVSSGGSQFVSDGAIVRDTVLKTGAYQEVEAVGSAYGTIIASGASQTVSGGLVSGTRLNGGSQTIFPDGSALRTIVEAGGLETIFGGSAIDTQIRAGGSQAVSGGVAIGTVVSSGGRQDVFQPGSALEVEVLSGGIQGLHGNTPDSGTEYRSGASQILYDGASSLDRAVSWVQIVSSGGAVSRGSLVFGGSQLVSSGGSATSVHISSGASQTIFEGGVASETRVSNGGWQIVSGGDAILTTVSSGGVQALYNATAEDADILRGGSQILFSGARDSATLLSGVQMIMSGGMATSTTVDSGGVQEVYSGGVASDTIVESRGTVNVFLGGSAMDVVQSSGGNVNIVAMGGTLGLATSVTGTNASGAALSLSRGVASGFIVYDEGYVSVAVGGSAIGTEVFSGGVIVASGGNIAGDTYIHASGNIVGDVVSMVGNDARLRMETELDENRETSASIAGTGAFHKLGAGTQTLTGNNTYDGPTIVSSGTLAGNIASGTDLTLLTAETVYDGRATSRTVGSLGGSGGVRNTSGFTVQSGGIFEGTIDRTNSGGVTMAGGSNMSLVLLGNNTYTGATSVASGGTILGNIASGTALHLGSNASYGGGSYEYDNDVVSLVGPANRVVGNLFGAQGARISDTSGLTVQGGGVFEGTIDDSNSGLTMAGGAGTSLVLMGENTYKGVTSVTRGGTILGNITSGTDLVLGSNASYGGGSYNSAGGLLSAASRVIGNLSGAKGARISDTDGLTVSGGGIFEGTIDDTNSGGLTKMGAGVLTLTGTSNAYFGSTLVAEGTIKGNINEDQDLVVAGGAFYDGANSGRNLPGIFGDGVISNVGGSGLTVTSGTFGGQILKTAALSKVGDAGTLTLTGHDAFSGPVAVYGGTLVVAGSSATINPTSLTMWNGTTFDFHEASPYADKATPLSVGALTVNGLSEKPAPPTILGNLRVGGDSRDPHTITYNLPETVANSAVLLTVSGSVAVDGGTKIALNFNGHYSGDIKRLVLIDVADDTTEGMGVYGTNGDLGTLTLVDDVTGDIYMLKVENLNDLVAVLMNVNPKGATYQRMKAYAESRLALLALINQGGEYIAYRGMSEVLAATKGEGLRIGAFGGMDGGRSRYDTGSDIDLLGQNVLAGIGVGGDSPIGRLSIGAFLDMGTGTYKSRNDFTDAMSVDGKGNTSYWGGGLMVRLDNSYGLHFEGIGRYGRGRLHFETEDIEYRKMTASFDTEADYYGAIAGLGWSFAIPGTDGKAKMDLGAKALWTELKPDTTTVQGNQLHFDDARSFRIRIGGRVGYAFNSRVTGYAGAYVEREFEGDQRARINERYVATPSLRGDTGIGEIGVTVRPMEDDIPLFLDIGVQGFTGTRQGLAGNVQVRLEY